jgi:hypothetical protein
MTTDSIVNGITMKTTSAEHGQNMFFACSFHGNSMNNLLSYCGLVDARISASEKDLPVEIPWKNIKFRRLRIRKNM